MSIQLKIIVSFLVTISLTVTLFIFGMNWVEIGFEKLATDALSESVGATELLLNRIKDAEEFKRDDFTLTKKYILSKKIGTTGYIYVLDSKGNVLVHPKLEGQNLWNAQESSGRYFIREMIAKKNGIIRYDWKNPGEAERREKIVVFKTLESTGFLIGAGSYTDEINSTFIQTKKRLTYYSTPLAIATFIILIWIAWTLRRVGAHIIRNSSDIKSATKEISVGNQDLASRTQEQAASLEETATTMETIANMVKATATNSQQAVELAKKAFEQVQSGLSGAEESLIAMKEISESSSKVFAIVTLVENIAFQTNILAINAAIEAAKAQEQGKGFAVVAIEIRDLAQRSAEATKEIKDLIDSTIQKVKHGEKLVEKEDQDFKMIFENMNQMSNILGQISHAATEQSTSIDQINAAIGQLDSVTQQNSSLVEEIASSSEQVAYKAEEMEKMISRSFGNKIDILKSIIKRDLL